MASVVKSFSIEGVDGRLRPCTGVLPMVMAAKEARNILSYSFACDSIYTNEYDEREVI